MTTGGFRRLPRNDEAQDQDPPAPAAPKGWGKPAAAAPAAAAPQREAIRSRVAAPAPQPEVETEEQAPAPVQGRSFFSQGIQNTLEGNADPAEAPQPEEAPAKPAPRPRATRAVKQEAVDTSVGKEFGGDAVLVEGAKYQMAHVEVKFYGDPAAVKAAMRAFLAA